MTRTAYRIAATLALLSTSQLGAAPVAKKPCMTRPELRGMIAYVMPTAMGMVIERCRPALGKNAALLTRGPQVVSELEAGQAAAYPMARQAFTKFADSGDKTTVNLMLSLPETSLKPVIESALSEKLMTSIKTENCPDIERVFGTLQPLPSANFVDFLTETLAIAMRDDKEMSICPA